MPKKITEDFLIVLHLSETVLLNIHLPAVLLVLC